MALIKCPECGREVSTMAVSCPHCGCPINSSTQSKPISYEHQIIKIRCWGRNQNQLQEKLQPYYSQGWEVESITEDHWQGGVLSPVYKVAMKRAKK